MKRFNPAKLPGVLRKISKGALSRSEAATALSCSERKVNRLMREHGVRRPRSPVHAARAAAENRRIERVQAARAVLTGRLTIEKAAKDAEISTRTLYRWLIRLKNSQKSRK